MTKKGEALDLTSTVEPTSSKSAEDKSAEKRFLGVHFECCDVYSRIYATRDLSAYVGHCPRCAKRVQFQVGTGGTDSRFFSVQ